LATKYPKATSRLSTEIANPAMVAIRSGTLEWFVMPSIAMS